MIENYKIHSCLINNIEWEYIVQGKGERVILFLNGGLRLAESANQYLEILCGEYQVIVPTYPPLYNVDEIILGIYWILEKEHVESAIIIGQSYGGMIAQVFSINYPEKVEKLVLNSTASIFTNQFKKQLSLIFLWLFMKMPSKWIRSTYKKGILKALGLNNGKKLTWIKNAEDIIDTNLSDKHIFSHFLTAKYTLRKYSDFVKKERKQIPTLIVNGEKDSFSTIKDHNKLIKDYPDSESIILENTGHIVVIEKPDEYKSILNKFIRM